MDAGSVDKEGDAGYKWKSEVRNELVRKGRQMYVFGDDNLETMKNEEEEKMIVDTCTSVKSRWGYADSKSLIQIVKLATIVMCGPTMRQDTTD